VCACVCVCVPTLSMGQQCEVVPCSWGLCPSWALYTDITREVVAMSGQLRPWEQLAIWVFSNWTINMKGKVDLLIQCKVGPYQHPSQQANDKHPYVSVLTAHTPRWQGNGWWWEERKQTECHRQNLFFSLIVLVLCNLMIWQQLLKNPTKISNLLVSKINI
jgi:hypothetical protein